VTVERTAQSKNRYKMETGMPSFLLLLITFGYLQVQVRSQGLSAKAYSKDLFCYKVYHQESLEGG
jgi:hypothetical protein